MSDGSSTNGLVSTAKGTQARRRGWLRIGWLFIAVACLAFAWRVQRAVRVALAPNALASETAYRIHGKTSLRHAKRFSVEYRSDSKLVRVVESSDGGDVARYQLVPRGKRAAVIDSKTVVVEIPVQRVIALSTAFVTAFTRLGEAERLVGLAGARRVTTPELLERVNRGQVAEVSDGSPSMDPNLDLERVRSLSPDLVVASYFGNSSSKLREAGLNVVVNSEWLESTPLGRAEWVKFMAAFLDREEEAERWFTGLEQRYAAVAEIASHVTTRPPILCGTNQRGTWYVPGGQSYSTRLIEDAGGSYPWHDDTATGIVPLKMEAVLARAQRAEIWLLHSATVRSKNEMIELEPRYALFDAMRSGRVYNSDARLNPNGGNDYWENGVANPDLLLLDLMAIIHPELVSGHTLRWYRRVVEGERS